MALSLGCLPLLSYLRLFLLCTALFLNHASSVPIFVLGRSSFEQSLPFSRRQPSGGSFAWQSLSGFFSQLLLRRATASRRECSFSCGVVFSWHGAAIATSITFSGTPPKDRCWPCSGEVSSHAPPSRTEGAHEKAGSLFQKAGQIWRRLGPQSLLISLIFALRPGNAWCSGRIQPCCRLPCFFSAWSNTA